MLLKATITILWRRQKEEKPEMDIDLDIYKTVGQAHFHHTNARVAEQIAAHQ